MLSVLSFGAGQDSTAILHMVRKKTGFKDLYLPGHMIAIQSDTGNEHNHTQAHSAEIRELCAQEGIPFYFLTPDMGYHSQSWKSLTHYYETHNAIGSKAFPKSCTDNLKIRPIYDFLEDYIAQSFGMGSSRKSIFYEYAKRHGKLRVVIGIAAGEEKRIGNTGPVWMQKCVEKVYPLVDLRMDRAACQDYITSVGEKVPFPSNCEFCPFVSEQELVWLHRFYPRKFDRWVELEENKLKANAHKGDKNLTVWGTKKRLPEVLSGALLKYGGWTDTQLNQYKMTHGHCVMSKY